MIHMEQSDIYKFQNKLARELRSGLYSLLILLIIDYLEKPTYGYELTKTIEEMSGGVFDLKNATTYPILKYLQKNRFIEGFWAEPERGPVRKYYKITEKGKLATKLGLEEWNTILISANKIIDAYNKNSKGGITDDLDRG